MKFFRPFQHLAVAVMTLLGSAAVPHIGQTAEFTLMPSPQTVHIGHFASNLKPVLSIESGDTVTIETSSLFAPEIIDQSGVVPPSAIPQYQRDIFREVKDRGPSGHVLTGPIEIRGAMPGDVLEVRILEVELALDWGVNRQRPYAGVLPDEFTALWMRVIPINRQTKTAEVGRGVVVPVDKPFFGTMGVAPDATLGRISSGPPGIHTGNLRDGPQPGLRRCDEDRRARNYRSHYEEISSSHTRGGLHDCERGRRLSCHTSRGRHQRHSWNDSESDLSSAITRPAGHDV